MAGFLKTTEAEQADQIDNFALKIGGYAVALDVTPAEVASAIADAAFFRWVINSSKTYDVFSKGLTPFKDLLKRNPTHLPASAFPTFPALATMPTMVAGGVLDRYVTLGKRLKLHGNFTNAIGTDLQLFDTSTPIVIATAKPVLKLFTDPAGIRIEFNLHETFDGVNIYKMAPGGAWVYLNRDDHSPYIDATPTVSGTHYRAFYVINDHEVGLVSDEVVLGWREAPEPPDDDGGGYELRDDGGYELRDDGGRELRD